MGIQQWWETFFSVCEPWFLMQNFRSNFERSRSQNSVCSDFVADGPEIFKRRQIYKNGQIYQKEQ